MSNEDYTEETNFIANLRTTIILAARKSPSCDIDIDAIDKIVEATIDFIKNLLEHMSKESQSFSYSPNDLLNTIRLYPFQLIKELIEVGKQKHALETLLEIMKSRRHRVWTKAHEPLMEKLLELCVELRKSLVAKDALHQYKTIAQTICVKSLEDVIMKFLKQGEQRCFTARQVANNAVIDIDDLEIPQTPENLLLSAVSSASQQDRTDRDVIAPWLKFLWESYKQCLDLLKNNNRVEKIYQEVAQMAFQFCQRYDRRPEFRKLCDTIRTHFAQSQKYSQQAYSVNFQLPETQAIHLETRLVQLDTAIAMQLWQEAFKAIEDIHLFTTISKRTPKPQQLAAYYDKVALVFWKAGNHIFHATTVLKLYILHKEQKKNITHAELRRLSTKTLLAILSIPLPTPRTQIDEHLDSEETLNEKNKRLTSILSLQQVPTRTNLIRDMIKQGVLNFVSDELKHVYEFLEVELNPLNLTFKIEQSIKLVENLAQPEYSQYIPALREVTLIRLLQQLSQVYEKIEFKRFLSLAPAIDRYRLERIIVNSSRSNDVQVHIDHKLQILTFGTDLNISSTTSSAFDTDSKVNILQKMPNEQIRNQLASMSHALYMCINAINENANKERHDRLRHEIAQTYFRDQLIQRKEILKRREYIERYKEDKEKEHKEKMRQAEQILKTKQAEKDEEDKTRREADQNRRLAEMALEKEREAHRFAMKVAIDRLRESEIGRKIIEVIDKDDLYKYDPESLNSLHIDAVIKHSREQKEKFKIQYKKVDYLIRAQHEAEIVLLQKNSEYVIQQRREIQRIERENAIKRRENLIRMEKDKNDFLQSIRGQRHDDYVEQMKRFEEKLELIRAKRLQELRIEYIEKKKKAFREEKKMKKKRQEEERQRQIAVEAKRKEEERLAVFRVADEEKKRRLAEQTRKQREREEEIERKLQAEKEAARQTSISSGHRRVANVSGSHYQERDKTDGRPRHRNHEVNENQSSLASSSDNWRQRNDEHRPNSNVDRRPNDSSSSKIPSNEPWRLKSHASVISREEAQNSGPMGSTSTSIWGRSDKSDGQRTRENMHGTSWRTKYTNENSNTRLDTGGERRFDADPKK